MKGAAGGQRRTMAAAFDTNSNRTSIVSARDARPLEHKVLLGTRLETPLTNLRQHTSIAQNWLNRMYLLTFICQEYVHGGPSHMRTSPKVEFNVDVWRRVAMCQQDGLCVLVQRQGRRRTAPAAYRAQGLVIAASSEHLLLEDDAKIRLLRLGRRPMWGAPHRSFLRITKLG